MTAWSESYTHLSPAESGPGNPSGLGDRWLGSWRYLKVKCVKEIYIQTSDFLVLKGVGFGIHQDVLGMRPQMEMLQLLERRECCSEQKSGLSKELLGKICFCQLNALICFRAQVPSRMAGRIAQSHSFLWQLGLCFLVRWGDFCPWMLEAKL